MRLIEQYFIFNIMVKFSLVFFRLDQPHNPMVNSGAIMSASILLYLLKPYMNMAQKYDYVFDFFKVCAKLPNKFMVMGYCNVFFLEKMSKKKNLTGLKSQNSKISK